MSSLKSLNVLLADDNQNMRAIAAAVLHSADIRNVHEAAEGATALSLLRRHPIDLAIVDFNMFPLDGVEFTRLVRNSPDSPNVYLPIIMMTGHSEKRHVSQISVCHSGCLVPGRGAVALFAIIAPLLSPTMPFDIRRTAIYQPKQTTYRPGLP